MNESCTPSCPQRCVLVVFVSVYTVGLSIASSGADELGDGTSQQFSSVATGGAVHGATPIVSPPTIVFGDNLESSGPGQMTAATVLGQTASSDPSEEGVRKRLRPLSDIQLNIRPRGTLPSGVQVESDESPPTADPLHPGSTAEYHFHWAPSELQQRPAYFDDVPLQRYGHTHHPLLQPAISAVKFFGSIPLLPCKMRLQCPGKPVYTLGYHRPGSQAPHVRESVLWYLRLHRSGHALRRAR